VLYSTLPRGSKTNHGISGLAAVNPWIENTPTGLKSLGETTKILKIIQIYYIKL
jgi:hypothetical protein